MTRPSFDDAAPVLVELRRGEMTESVHRGIAAVCAPDGALIAAWGDVDRPIYPRSSCKMLQALPLVESGAADRFGLNDERLALACASHNGARMHVARVRAWLADLGLAESDLRCGPQRPDDREERERLRACGCPPDQTHNNCSGKHAGFLTLGRHLGGGSEYVDPDHPVQRAVAEAFHEMTGQEPIGYGIDGCSAPNHAARLRGLALAMARMARPEGTLPPARAQAARRLTEAMAAHPELVAGEGRACTELMRAVNGGGRVRAVIKTGAEGVFAAILPELGLGVALKIDDGATRASEAAIAAILVRLGVADPQDPAVRKRLSPDEINRRGLRVGALRAVLPDPA
ncbi:asparaginase [Oceanicella actignis]|uniref:Asparaginase n=1 Tax=Oceanicella actignis TaxID=1189325 RepID=A0A1M7TF03_9RHOB|nr:asparaginase [Oceanicella actignis]TYO88560.1 asparaginase [Oceanicella actignis]SET61449.1 asparaginase [Oceanicella actignis]SHN69342.1 asparaginase [Oceanicella actignis]